MKTATTVIAIVIFLACPIRALYAMDTDVDASVQMRAAITLSKTKDMDFGIIDYNPSHSGLIQLATNDTVTLSGASGLVLGGGTPAAGDITIGGDGQSIVEISCETSGTLSDGTANNLNLQSIEYAIDTGVAFGAGTACAGLGTSPFLVDLVSNPAPRILLGGEIDVSGDAIAVSSLYSTTNAGGDPVTVQVVYQ